MLENVAKITRVVLACGTVDMRKGIDGLSMIIGDKYKQNLFEKGISSASHRIEQEFQRNGVNISRQTMSNIVFLKLNS